MATAQEIAIAAAVWDQMIDDPAVSGTRQTAAWMLGHARWDAYQSFANTVAILNEVRAVKAMLEEFAEATGIDPEALAKRFDQVMAAVVNRTQLVVPPLP